MSQLERIAALLVSDDPRRKAEKLLRYVVLEASAHGGAVLAVVEDRLVPFAVQDIDLDLLSKLRDAWPLLRGKLAKGSVSVDKDFAVAPIKEDGELRGALVLQGQASFDAEDLSVLLMLLGKTLVAEQSVEATPPVPVSATEAEREQLLGLLHQHDWNIAKVANLLGLNRGTIYFRLRRYGIQRKKLPRTLRRTVPI